MALSAKHISLGYKQGKVVKCIHKQLNLELKPGKLVTLIGPNGSGKSTLLKTMAGLLPTLSGELYFKHQLLYDISLEARSKIIALVLTERITNAQLTVEALVSLGRYPYLNWMASFTAQDNAVVERAIELCCLEDLRNVSIAKLSDGERQRAMIARAIAQDTEVIILDEPTAHLDLKSRVEVLLLLRNLARTTNKAIVVATHELELAINLADYIWLMPAKNEFKQGVPEDLVLNGILPKTFNSGQIRFDELTGTFRVQNQKDSSVKLIGGNLLLRFWTSKALERVGISIDDNATITVEIANETWNVGQHNFKTLEQLIENI